MGKDSDIVQAVRDQDTVRLEKLLEKLKSKKHQSGFKKIINFQDDDGMAAIHQAALQSNANCIDLLINNDADYDLADNKGMRALHYAAWQGCYESVLKLLEANSDRNTPSHDGNTPLHFACQHGHLRVVDVLLKYKADPKIVNSHLKTPLDMACEFGKEKVVQLLIESSLCDGLLHDHTELIGSIGKSTPLHWAARGGNVNIIRLLLKSSIDVNRQTHQGTALHEAALFGKLEAVKVLIDAGIDVNVPNSYEQTALDIVDKFTRKAGAKELKRILQEASFSIKVKAVKSYSNTSDTQSLTFQSGDIITVIEQKPNGLWRGFIVKDGVKIGPGHFPSNCVAIDRTGKSAGDNGAASLSLNDLSPHDSKIRLSSSTSSSELTSPTQQRFPPNLLYAATAAADCEANGIQYPPPSPSWRGSEMGTIPENYRVSTCSRTSSTSTDSRVNVYPQSQPQAINANVHIAYNNNAPPCHPSYQQRLSSSHSYGDSISRQSLHSNSSSSMGSLDVLEEPSNVNVAELYRQGVAEHDIIYTWLSDLRYEAYLKNFVEAGYDMPTISRMTPEDLTAIGITNPGNRKKLTREISKLRIHDGTPDQIPSSVLGCLQAIGLDEYFKILQSQGYDTLDKLLGITWEDMEEIGVNKLGHQKKISLLIERIKKLRRRQSQSSGHSHGSTSVTGSARWSHDLSTSSSSIPQDRYRHVSGDDIYNYSHLPQHSRESSPFNGCLSSKSVHDVHRSSNRLAGGDCIMIKAETELSRSSSGNSVNSGSDYSASRLQLFPGQIDKDNTPPSSEDSGSSCGGSMKRSGHKTGPLKAIHGLQTCKHPSQDSIDASKRNSMEGVSQYATLRRAGSRKQSLQSFEFNESTSSIGAPSSPAASLGSCSSPAHCSLPSPFANFKSPYAQIQSGEVKNQLHKEKRSSSVPSSPIAKSAPMTHSMVNGGSNKRPPAPPKRTLSLKKGTNSEADSSYQLDSPGDSDLPPLMHPLVFNIESMTSNIPPNSWQPSQARESLKLQSVAGSGLAARRIAGSGEREGNMNNSNSNSSLKSQSSDRNSNRSSSDRSLSTTPRNSTENIPFANDNIGTIKQKSVSAKATISESDFIEMDMERALGDNDSGFDSDTVKRMPKSVMQLQPTKDEYSRAASINNQLPDYISEQQNSKDVFSDIDNMLDGLSTELDAMLES